MESERAKTLEELQTRMSKLSSRDLQLWSIGPLIVIILAVGFAALAAPNLMWADRALSLGTRYLPQLLFGFVVLITLFNIYLIAQRRELEAARKELMSELLFRQRIETVSLLDPLTQIFNRRYLEYALPREVALANRHDAPLSFLLFDLDDFGRLNSHSGHMVGDEALIATAKLLGSVFGATETLLRYGADEFLALLPECSSEQAQERVQQVLATALKTLFSGQQHIFDVAALAVLGNAVAERYAISLACGLIP
jgi:diguanylate cyclase (GGDEF)-like protein